jgi:nucleotide-binding universal stress UspA family protein
MFKNILVPLDGSNLAETALPAAASLAGTLDARVTLLHVIEKDASQAIHNDHHLTRPDEADAYLKEIAKKAFPKNIKVKTHVHTAEVKDVAASIVQHSSEEFKPDLIVMCAHGQGGFRDVIFGNIAQQVLAGGQTPILLVQPESVESRPFAIRRIFVPLDSESIHDDCLPCVQELAKAYDAEIYLLTVIPTYGTLSGEKAAASSMLPITATAFLDIKEETGKEHLQTHLDELNNAGYKVTAEISRGDPATVITETAKRVEADLMILSTHRKAGMEAFWARSVAPNVVRWSKIPVLLLPARGDHSS